MPGIVGASLLAALLVILLALVASRSAASDQGLALLSDWPQAQDEFARQFPPGEYVERIFSREDWEFVAGTDCRSVRELFRRERKTLALLWVEQTRLTFRKIMREHLETARSSSDLEFATEAKILLHYAELHALSVILILSIQCAGPLWLRGAARYLNEVTRKLGETQRALRAATETGEAPDLRAS